MSRTCSGITPGGDRCKAPPMRESTFCFWHDPAHEAEAAEARRLGGIRRRRESTLQGAYEIESTDTVASLQRILDIAAIDLLSLENSVARNGKLVTLVLAGARLLEVGLLSERIEALETSLGPRFAEQRR